jgi:hypothetical protein
MSDSGVVGLIEALNDPDTTVAEEAKAELEGFGAAMVGPLLEAIPAFDAFATLLAIELLEEFGNERAGGVLIPLLSSENRGVREWAARAVGVLSVRESVDALTGAYEQVKREGTPLHWTEPIAIREALTRLGARREVVPPLVAALMRDVPSVGPAWWIEDVGDAIDALADANQAVVSTLPWAASGDRYLWVRTQTWEPDWTLLWAQLVEQTRQDSKDAIRRSNASADTVVTLIWMNADDL